MLEGVGTSGGYEAIENFFPSMRGQFSLRRLRIDVEAGDARKTLVMIQQSAKIGDQRRAVCLSPQVWLPNRQGKRGRVRILVVEPDLE